MTDGRQTTRSTPVEVKAGPDGDSFWAKPLPWRKRNDLGNQITTAYVNAINGSLRAEETEKGEVTFSGGYREALFDWDGCLRAAYPDIDMAQFEPLDIFEIRELLVASCVANGLKLEYMIDPNSRNPEPETATPTGEPTDGQKTTSSEDSGEPVIQ